MINLENLKLIHLSNLNKFLVILILILIIVLYLCNYNYNYKFKTIESFFYEEAANNTQINNGVTINLDSHGFFSQINFALNSYIYCKKNNINFKILSDLWIYKINDGWLDYFENIDLIFPNSNSTITKTLNGCCTTFEKYPLSDFINELPNFYKLNNTTLTHIKKNTINLGLNNTDYGALYIRRGDKLVEDTKFTPAENFISKLLQIYPDCKKLFVQTDDYNCVKDIKEYINKYNLKIHVLTLCPENIFGAIANNNYLNKIKSKNITYMAHTNNLVPNENKEYLSKIILSKPISDMTQNERRIHTLELLTSVDICTKSKYCVCDYSSNISRFIKIAHNNFDSVFDINGEDATLSINTKACPGNDFNSIFNK